MYIIAKPWKEMKGFENTEGLCIYTCGGQILETLQEAKYVIERANSNSNGPFYIYKFEPERIE